MPMASSGSKKRPKPDDVASPAPQRSKKQPNPDDGASSGTSSAASSYD